MRISSNNIHQLIKQYQSNTQKSRLKEAQGLQKTQKSDSFELSETARSIDLALGAIRKAPDIREEKLKEIVEKLHSSEDYIKSEDIVNSLLGGSL